MCGVIGLLLPGGGEVPEEAVVRARDAMAHRGPDDEGIWRGEGIVLGHRRLSIIDLDPRAKGPLANEDGTVLASFNGEIYNFRELREELLGKGHEFRTEGDTEVLVHLWEEEGPAMVGRLRGMFAFAVWDARRRRLLLARDRVGQKPLYLHRSVDRIAFASELSALTRLPGVPGELDPVSIHHYLSLQYVPCPRTVWRDVECVPPATWMLWEDGRWRSERYWDLDYRRKLVLPSEEEYAERLRELLLDAVRVRLVSDVPLGAFLSGGVDSAAVVAAMAREAPGRVRTFTVGFPEEAWDERRYARLVAERYGTDHTEEVVEPEAAADLVAVARRYGQPYADPSAVPTYHVARVARRHVTVALTGDGGDESFAGYDRYRAERLAHAYRRLPAWMRRGLFLPAARALPSGLRQGSLLRKARRFVTSVDTGLSYLTWICYFTPAAKAELYTDGFAGRVAGEDTERWMAELFAQAPADHWLDRTLWVDVHTYLPHDLQVKMDIASMAVSLEARSPLLDHRVLEFAASLPPRLKLRGLTAKALLKRAVRDWVPEPVLRRRKMGFGVPLETWFRGELRGMVRDLLLGAGLRERGWFRPEEVERLVREHEEGRMDHSYRLWALLVLEVWLRELA
jgi:asparagine synthase (glutamine-hydrolysing)